MTEVLFQELLVRHNESRLTVRDFCSNNGIPKTTFYYWKNKLNTPAFHLQAGEDVSLNNPNIFVSVINVLLLFILFLCKLMAQNLINTAKDIFSLFNILNF